MRGVAVFITGLFVLTAVTMMAGVVLEPIHEIVVNDAAVEAQGLDDDASGITNTILRWMPALWIAYLLVWAAGWYLRRERMTGVRRR